MELLYYQMKRFLYFFRSEKIILPEWQARLGSAPNCVSYCGIPDDFYRKQLGNATGGTLLGFAAKKCLNDANTPGENSTPELFVLKII